MANYGMGHEDEGSEARARQRGSRFTEEEDREDRDHEAVARAHVLAKHSMNKTPGEGPIAEALTTLDDELARLENVTEMLIGKIRPVLGPNLSDDRDTEKDGGLPDSSDVRLSILTKCDHVRRIRSRLEYELGRVEL